MKYKLLTPILLLLLTFQGFGETSKSHAAKTKVLVKLNYESGQIPIKDIAWDKSHWSTLLQKLDTVDNRNIASCDQFGDNYACRLVSTSDDAAESSTYLSLYFDSYLNRVSIDIRISYSEETLYEDLQEILIGYALDRIPTALNTGNTHGTWTINSSDQRKNEQDNSLYTLVLANPHLKEKIRTINMEALSIWSVRENVEDVPNTFVFIKETLRYTTKGISSIAHAEALVHPAMISHKDPKRVLLISDMPFAPLGEIVKYNNLQHVDVVGTSQGMRQTMQDQFNILEKFGSRLEKVSFSDMESVLEWAELQVESHGYSLNLDESYFVPCSEDEDQYQIASMEHRSMLSTLCENEEQAKLNKIRGFDWERQIYCKDKYFPLPDTNQSCSTDGNSCSGTPTQDLYYDIILVDVPSYALESLTSSTFHRHLASMFDPNGDSILVVSAGAAPSVKDDGAKENLVRDKFLRQLTRSPDKDGMAYPFATVYDELLAEPLSTAFVLAFQNTQGDAYDGFYRTVSPSFDKDMCELLIPITGIGRPPTLLYDGPTHMRYQTPSRSWENWYCRTSPGKDLPGCAVFQNWLFDPSRQHVKVERRNHPVKGSALYALEFIPQYHFVNLDDIIYSMTIDQTQWDALVAFVEKYPNAEFYRQLRDFYAVYGFEVRDASITGWSVSLASNNTFSNHACSDDVRTTTTAEYFVKLSEDGTYLGFSPPIARRPRLAAYATISEKDIHPGDEIEINYQGMRTDISEHPYFDMYLNQMCSDGVGMVPVVGE